MKTISELRKIMQKNSYKNVYGTPTTEYHFENIGAWIEKRGSKLTYDKSKPYSVRYRGLGKNFKTLSECLEYISMERYINESELVKRACKNSSFHYNVNAI